MYVVESKGQAVLSLPSAGGRGLRCSRVLREMHPLPSSLIRYCLFPLASITIPALFHVLLGWSCMSTLSPGWRGARWRVVTYGQHSVMVLFHLTFTLPQCSSPESVYLKLPPDSWYAVAQLTARCQLSWGSVYAPQRRVEVLQEGEPDLVVVEASTCSSVATQYSFR